ncbi:MAG: efflux RND transporter permease subunit [Planctomycetota bacterium]|jgi:HAE1 family hydrophobic/amphiphilic exporter-1
MKGPLAGAARRPVAVLMVVAAVVVFGLVSYGRLDLALLPDLNYPTLTVRTEFGGAGPREVLEKRLATTSGLVAMTSVSRSSFSDITLEFRWDADMTTVRSDIEAKIAAATLPDEAKRPLVLPYDPNLDPILRVAVSARGAAEKDLALARKLAEEEVEKELKKLNGVAAAKIRGGREREIAVHLNEEDLRRTRIRLQTVSDVLQGANRNEAAGLLNEGPIEYVVRSVNELRTVEEIEDLVVKMVNGVALRIRDIGRVEESYKERELAAFLDGKEAVLVEVYKKADANLVAVATAVRERLFAASEAKKPEPRGRRRGGGHRRRPSAPSLGEVKSLSASLQDWVTLKVLTDQSRFIEGAIREVRDTALLGGLLAILVLYLFLRNALSTFIAGSVIGICVVATFAPMFLAGVSLNIMSLGGLALGVGMLVDNAIVVLESAARKRAQGLAPLEAAVQGVGEVAGAITASTLTSVCVFFPIVFVEEAGIAGQIFRDLALTVVFSILVSLAVALFVIPMCLATIPGLAPEGPTRQARARFGWRGVLLGDRTVLAWAKLRRRRPLGKLWFGSWFLLALPFLLAGRLIGLALRLGIYTFVLLAGLVGRIGRAVFRPLSTGFLGLYGALERGYPAFLRACLAQRALVCLLALAALVYAGWRASALSPDLIPEAWTGEFEVKVSFAPGTPLERTAVRMREVEALVRERPEVAWVAATVGVEADADRAADEGEHTAHLTVNLEPPFRTPEAEREVRHAVDRAVRSVPDVLPPEFLPSTLFRFAIPLRLVFFGGGEEDLGRISRAAEETAAELRKLRGIESVQAGFGRGAREIRLAFDRVALFRFGLSAEEVANRVRAKIQGQIPTALVEGSTRTDIRVRVQESDRDTLRDLVNLDIAPPGAQPVPLHVVLKGEPVVAEGPGEIRRVGGRHAAVVTAAYEGLQLERISARAAEIARPVAARHGIDVEVAGRSREAKQSTQALLYALLLAVFLVYAVMAAQFESLWQPVLIMVSLPLAGVGAIVALDVLALPLSVVVLLGTILLVGIAVNNAIVLVDCINRRRADYPTLREAIVQAARERLRPILMTTATTILGLLPLTGLLAGLPGAESLPLGLGGGEAAELRAPMAITVIGGLFTSTLLTLVLVPVLYDVGARRGRPA